METDNKDNQHDIIYALRTAQQHHVQLGLMADNKANIILGSFLIFITVTQSLLEKNMDLNIPIWTLTAFYSLSAIFALLVIMPRFREKKVLKGETPSNLLFFGSFSRMSIDEYVSSLSAKLTDDQSAREMMMRDIYLIGQVLQKKYTNLRLSYSLLAVGVGMSLLSYVVINIK